MKRTYGVSFIPLMLVGMGGVSASEYLAYYSKNVESIKPLHYAAMRGQTEIVRALLAQGYMVGVQTAFGMLPIHYAAESNSIEVLKELIAHDSPINSVDVLGRTALMCAVQAGAFEACQVLITQATLLDLKTIEGMTALMYAARRGDRAMVKLLVEHGADIWAQDLVGAHALDHAMSWGKTDVAEYLAQCMEESYGRTRMLLQYAIPLAITGMALGTFYGFARMVYGCYRSVRAMRDRFI